METDTVLGADSLGFICFIRSLHASSFPVCINNSLKGFFFFFEAQHVVALGVLSNTIISASSRLWRKEVAEDTRPVGMVAAGTPLSPPAVPTVRPAQAPPTPPPPRFPQPRMMPNLPATKPRLPLLIPHQMPKH